MVTEQEIWTALDSVMDPEIPKLSVVDLGMVSSISIDESGAAEVEVTPTFAGCPAIDFIKRSIRDAVVELGVESVTVNVNFDRQWNSNMISEKGRALIKDWGLAPPPVHDGYISLDVLQNVACPHCDSRNTTMQTPFGPTLCRSIHYCNNCSQAFEQFKPVTSG